MYVIYCRSCKSNIKNCKSQSQYKILEKVKSPVTEFILSIKGLVDTRTFLPLKVQNVPTQNGLINYFSSEI